MAACMPARIFGELPDPGDHTTARASAAPVRKRPARRPTVIEPDVVIAVGASAGGTADHAARGAGRLRHAEGGSLRGRGRIRLAAGTAGRHGASTCDDEPDPTLTSRPSQNEGETSHGCKWLKDTREWILRLSGVIGIAQTNSLHAAARAAVQGAPGAVVVDLQNADGLDTSATQILVCLQGALAVSGRILRVESTPPAVAELRQRAGLTECLK